MRVPLFLLLAVLCVSAEPTAPLDAAMHRIYSLDFAGGQAAAAEASRKMPQDPLPPAVLTAGRLFAELDRLQLLGRSDKAKGRPDAAARRLMQESGAEAIRRAEAVLERDPANVDALTALMLVHGVERDYLALVEKSYRASWTSARKAQEYALQLVAKHPQVQDAWFTIGFSDYLIASVPFVFRPFMKMESADGDRRRGVRNLERAADGGRFLKGFARMLLVNIYRKDGRKADAERLLRELAREYPVNPAFRRELGDGAGL